MDGNSLGVPEGVAEDHGRSSDESEGLDEFDNFGYEAIDRTCKMVYPDQPSPLQSMPFMKMWLGGADPIDFIRMYSNEGDTSKNIPPHWHYVTFGFSDLYGDERVHKRVSRGEASGFGFELTFRLKRNPDDSEPPSWPVNLINRLSRYVFQTGNVLHVGDHIPWHNPLDGESSSHIKHMLVCEDPQLLDLDTPYGTVEFRQVIGVMDDEIKAAQKWRGAGMLQLLCKDPHVGSFFVTDMEREKSLFEKNPDLKALVTDGIEKDGSNLGHVTALFSWRNLSPDDETTEEERKAKPEKQKAAEAAPISDDNKENLPADTTSDEEEELPVESLDAVHLKFDAEAAELLPMVVRGRLKKGRFFIFRNAECMAVHLVPSMVGEDKVYVEDVDQIQATGDALQIYCSPTLINEMSEAFEDLQTVDEDTSRYPKEFRFSNPSIVVTVYPRGVLSLDDPLPANVDNPTEPDEAR